MSERYDLLLEFNRRIVSYALPLREVLATILLTMALGGAAFAKLEGISLGDGVYFAFITGLSVGYGDITPHTTPGRIVSIIIGMIGLLFFGLIVAIATRALRDAFVHSKDSR